MSELLDGPGIDVATTLAYVMAYANGGVMSAERVVKLFRNGRNQAVRIPREFELPGREAVMREFEQLRVNSRAPLGVAAGLEWTTDFAASIAFLKPSSVAMSGAVAPSRT